MKILSRLAERIGKMFRLETANAAEAFGVKLLTSSDMDSALNKWNDIFMGKPPWKDAEDEIDTANVASLISNTRSKLTMLDIGIALSESPRTEYMQKVANNLVDKLSEKLPRAFALGGMMIKFNGASWDFIYPERFAVTEKDSNGNIRGAIFASQKEQDGHYFTRLEWHRFETVNDDTAVYRISNKVYESSARNENITLGKQVDLKQVRTWAHLQPEVTIANIDEPLFAYFRVPGANNVDLSSPLGASVFADAINEFKAIDTAISRKNAEIEDSKHITFVGQSAIQSANVRNIKLPRFVKGLGTGLNDGETSAIHEHVPTLLTEQRIKDINFNLSLAGVKCGFSEGVFVMDGQTGMMTATQVEADDRDTIQTIKTDRDALKSAVTKALKSADTMTTLYGKAPLGIYDINFNFGDITYSYEEDKVSWKSYVLQGWVPVWLYLVKFEGMSEDEAKALVEEAKSRDKGLFEE